jgi:hypothetical protein
MTTRCPDLTSVGTNYPADIAARHPNAVVVGARSGRLKFSPLDTRRMPSTRSQWPPPLRVPTRRRTYVVGSSPNPATTQSAPVLSNQAHAPRVQRNNCFVRAP